MKLKKSPLDFPASSTDEHIVRIKWNRKDASSETLSDISDVSDVSDINELALLRKIDLHVVPALCLLFFFAFLERVNIASAAIYGMKKELKLVGNQFNAALTIFFVPYILLAIPGSLLVKRFSPRVWLPACMFISGCICIAQGFVKSYSGLLATRFFMGAAEASVFPGCFYLISMWYKRGEAQKRFTSFFGSTSLGSAIGGLLAYGISKLEGKAGLAGWQWVFIVEGLMTIGYSIVSYFIITGFPEEAKWLSDDERAFIKTRLAEDVGDSQLDDKTTWRDVLGVFKDFKIVLGGLMYLGLIVPGYGYTYFYPVIVQSFGYSPLKTLFYVIPPWVATSVLSLFVAITSDYYKRRFIFILPMMFISVVGMVVLLTVHDNVNVRYGALFLAVTGQYAASPMVICWFSTNLAGHLRRSVGNAFQISLGNCGAIIATFSFLVEDSPKYVKGYIISIGFIGLSAIFCTIYLFALISENRKRARGQSEYSGRGQKEKARLGDLNPDYRYML